MNTNPDNITPMTQVMDNNYLLTTDISKYSTVNDTETFSHCCSPNNERYSELKKFEKKE
jgi:hypothetical protein